MKLTQPILKGTHIGSHKDGITWVDFRYERLPTFCYFCGRIGHDESSCGKSDEFGEGTQAQSKDLGAWIRAENVGKKIGGRHESSSEEIDGGDAVDGSWQRSCPREQQCVSARLMEDAKVEDGGASVGSWRSSGDPMRQWRSQILSLPTREQRPGSSEEGEPARVFWA
ncbi:hypothetical protein PIB30_062915 [Stylosanthes scabra]|uniref:CCHC-type domain-containing protein n=1 Tax=Stylosanthes scabra TaxID=79078 RepID=A0ABU6TM66_9FABA|nr:hypothetical protein [Stylosanthes scabra]